MPDGDPGHGQCRSRLRAVHGGFAGAGTRQWLGVHEVGWRPWPQYLHERRRARQNHMRRLYGRLRGRGYAGYGHAFPYRFKQAREAEHGLQRARHRGRYQGRG